MMKDTLCNKCKMEVNKDWLFCPHCSSNLLLHGDTNRNNLQTHLEEQIIPFYEKFTNKFTTPYYLTSLLIGLPFLILHIILGITFKENTFADRSWMISLMIGYTFLMVVWNTKKLRTLTLNLFDHIESDTEQFHATSIQQLKKILSTKRLLGYGVSFGLLNTSFGVLYGIWYVSLFLVISIMVQFFVEGFICGMAVCGIVGVVKMVSTFSVQENIAINYRSPDKCGGISKIGNSLLQFSLTSLSVGVLISLYIYLSPWTNRTQEIVKFSIYVWMGFPHFAAISVLLLPLLMLHSMLEKLKHKQDLFLLKRCASLRNSLADLMHASENKDFHHLNFGFIHYTQMSEMHAKVQSLCTWPFDSRSGFIYIVGFLISGLVPITQLAQLAQMFNVKNVLN